MADEDLGSDIAGVFDIDPTLREVSGRIALLESVARRFLQPRGEPYFILEGNPTYGLDLRGYLSGTPPRPGEIESLVPAEAMKDERVLDADAEITFVDDELTVDLEITDEDGPFSLTLRVTKLTVELLKGAA